MTEFNLVKFENSAITNEYLSVLERKGMSSNTIINYTSALKRINDHLATVGIRHNDVTLSDIYTYIASLEHYAAQTRNLHLTCLQSFYTYMVEIGARTAIPITKHMRSKIDRQEPDYLPVTWQKVYISFLKNHCQGDQAIGAEIMLATGLRISELMEMDLVKDVEFRESKAYIRVRKSKGRKERICPVFNPELTPKIKQLITMYFPLGSYQLNLYHNAYLYANQMFYDKHKIKVTPHILRYTFATERAQEGLSIDIIRRLLGHRFYTTTLMYIVENQQQIYNLI